MVSGRNKNSEQLLVLKEETVGVPKKTTVSPHLFPNALANEPLIGCWQVAHTLT
jgi:hypothetical protein